MRKIRLGIAAVLFTAFGLGAVVAFPSDAGAAYCGKLDPACRAVCSVGYELGFQCID